jgi:Uma2 family endonuclease
MAMLTRVRPITVEEYLAGEMVTDIRHEFAGGDVHTMPPETATHNLIAGAFMAALHGHLRETDCRVFGGMMKLRLGDDFYYPDVFVACDSSDAEPYFKRRPLLIVEVLSPETAERDTQDKLVAYQAIDSLREYVLAEQDQRGVHIHRQVGDGWESATYMDAAALRLKSVDLAISLDEIYRDVVP